jgi:hypothetical protein
MNPDDLTQHFSFEKKGGDTCLPMAVRYKLDTVGIKLHLEEWARLTEEERRTLLTWPCASEQDAAGFAERLTSLLESRTGRAPEVFAPLDHPEWLDSQRLPEAVQARAAALGWRSHWLTGRDYRHCSGSRS